MPAMHYGSRVQLKADRVTYAHRGLKAPTGIIIRIGKTTCTIRWDHLQRRGDRDEEIDKSAVHVLDAPRSGDGRRC